MTDSHLQALKRRWLSSRAPEDEAELLRERARAGDLAQRDLELAAYLEHPAAQAVLPDFALPAGYRHWLAGLGAWSDRLALRGYALALAALVGDAHPATRDYFLEAAASLGRGERPAKAPGFVREHVPDTAGGAWPVALSALKPRCYLAPEAKELTAVRARYAAQLEQDLGPDSVGYYRSERRADGWVHVFTAGDAARTWSRPLRPLPASPGWAPAPGEERAPPGRGLLDTLDWAPPDTPELRAAVRDALLPEIVGWDTGDPSS